MGGSARSRRGAPAQGVRVYRSLIADITLPVLLLIHVPAFFGRASRERRHGT